MNLPSITITGGALSDIFFNFDHTTLTAAQNASEDGLDDAQYRAALTIDAAGFCAMIGEPSLVEQLIDDFMARL